MYNLTKEDLERISTNLDETEKDCLPIAYNIMQKIIGILDEPHSGRSEMVDVFKSVATSLFELSDSIGNNG